MKIVIDIPDNEIPTQQDIISVELHCMDGKIFGCNYPIEELPKNHGNLKDVDAIHEEIHRLQSGIAKNGGAVIINRDQYKGLCYARGIINEAPTIIEADKEEEDVN